MNQEILNYIKEAQVHGLTDLEIKQNLLSAGWEASEVEDNFFHIKALQNQIPSNRDEDIAHPKVLPAANEPAQIRQDPAKPDVGGVAAGLHSTIPSVVFQTPRKGFKKLFVIIPVLLLLLVGTGFYAYSVLGFYNPDKIWERFWANQKTSAYSYDFELGYADNGSPDALEAKISSQGYINQNTDPTEYEAAYKLFIKSKEVNFDREARLLVIGGVLYIDLSSVPEIMELFKMQEEFDGWVKLDSKKLTEAMNGENAGGQTTQNFDIFKTELNDKFKKLFSENNPIKASNFAGIEKISGVYTIHLKNQLDENALTKLIMESAKALSEAQNSGTNPVLASPALNADLEKLENSVKQFFEKFEIKEFDVWIGIFDNKPHKVKITSNAPSLPKQGNESIVDLLPLGSARAKSRDAKRLADIRQMAAALELYFNDYSKYPSSKDGQPLGIMPMYIGQIPTAPMPTDGNCTEYYNTYWYEIKNNGNSFQLTFCLGDSTGGYPAGINMLTPSGIQTVENCPSTPENCYKSPQAPPEEEPVNYNADFKYEMTYSDYGKIKQLSAPENPTDLFELIFGQMGEAIKISNDSRRLADIRQFASALELYYNDKGSYPENLGQLNPNYIGALPTPPIPPGGNCTESENQYSYNRIDKENYKLTFCLGEDIDGYKAGVHILSPKGIE